MRAERTNRRQEVSQISIKVTYDALFNTGASTERQRMCIMRLDIAVVKAMDSFTARRLTGTKKEDQDRATITKLGNTIVTI